MNNNKRVLYDSSQEPIVFSKYVSDMFLKSDNPAELLALYWFYYYTAKWQRTNQPKATTEYTAQGLKWSIEKVRKYKKQLRHMGLITDYVQRDQSNKVLGHFVHVHFIWSKEQMNHPTDFPDSGSSQTVAQPGANALSTNNKNALSTNNRNALKIKLHSWTFSRIQVGAIDLTNLNKEERTKKLIPISVYLAKIVNQKLNINITKGKLLEWADNIRKLIDIDKIDFERIENVLAWYEDNIGQPFTPEAYSGYSFRMKFLQLESAIDRQRFDDKVKKNGKHEGDPLEILKKGAKKNFDYTLLHKTYLESVSNITDCDKAKLAQKISNLYLAVEKARPEDYDIRVIDVSAGLVQKYSHWLFNSDWITDAAENSFDINSGLFKKYVREFKEETGVHPLTGR